MKSPTTAAVPGFDFLHQLAQGGAASWAQWVAPTLDVQALDKRIEELKAVQFWLDQNAAALKATIQALQVQKMTLATLRSMNVPLAWPAASPAAAAAAAAAPQAAQAPAKASGGPESANRRPSRSRVAAGGSSGTAAPAAAQAPQQPARAAAALPDPMQLWGALAQQFQQIAAQTLKDVSGRGAAPAAAAAPKAATARRRKAG